MPTHPGPSPRRSLAMRGLLLDTTAAGLTATFRAAGIQTLLLKGPTVARWLYTDVEPRSYVDIDLLVRPSDFAAAEALLAAQGYRHALDGAVPSELWEAPGGRVRRRCCRSPPVRSTGSRRQSRTWRELSAGSETIIVGGASLRMPREAARCVLLALHAAHHRRAAGQPIRDLELAHASAWLHQIWVAAVEVAQRLGVVDAFATGLRIVDGGSTIADALALPTRTSSRASHPRRVGSRIAWNFERLVATRGLRARTVFVTRKLAPTPAFMRHRYRLPPGAHGRLAAAYVRRPLGLLLGLPSSLRTWWRLRRRAGR